MIDACSICSICGTAWVYRLAITALVGSFTCFAKPTISTISRAIRSTGLDIAVGMSSTNSSATNPTEISTQKELPDLPAGPTVSPSLRQRLRQLCIHLWIWELLSLLLCLSCVGAIMAILLRYDGKPMPDWQFGLTINGVISVLAGVAKAAMILPVAESISQLKWHWFWKSQARPIMDFEFFDTASRGPWGCLMLLCRPRQWSLVSLGAFITLLALLVEPSLQFIPSYPLRQTAAGKAFVPRSTYYNDIYKEWTIDRTAGRNGTVCKSTSVPLQLS